MRVCIYIYIYMCIYIYIYIYIVSAHMLPHVAILVHIMPTACSSWRGSATDTNGNYWIPFGDNPFKLERYREY